MVFRHRLKATAMIVLPTTVISALRPVVRAARMNRARLGKHWRAWKAPLLHARLLVKHRGARPIRVVFLVSHTSAWKVSPVFARMLADDDFQPIAMICPVVDGQLAIVAEQTADAVRRFLASEGFPYVDLTILNDERAKAEVDRTDPHLLFSTDPNPTVPKALRDDLFRQRLSCYVPYSHEVMEYGNNQEQHNKESHNAFWRIFVPHDVSRSFTRRHAFAAIWASASPVFPPVSR